MNNLSTVQDFIRWATTQFERSDIYLGHGTDNTIDEAKHLILPLLNLPLTIPPEFYAARLTNEEKKQILAMIEKRINDRVPTPYLTNQAWFCQHLFYVDERVIIPRSPIAELIDNHFLGILSQEPSKILDLCTGSGCIGIACSYQYPQAQVDLVDYSASAIDVAEMNTDLHQLGNQVTPILSDLFSQVIDKDYDLIVTNPPYVDAEDMDNLPVEFLFEPKMALEAGMDGLTIVKRILNDAPNYLSDNGVLICEVGNSWIHLQSQYPEVDFRWLTFERGGHGVFCMTKPELLQYKNIFCKGTTLCQEIQ